MTRTPATVVSGENEAFAWQISQLSKGKRVIKTSVQPNPVGFVCRQVVGMGSVVGYSLDMRSENRLLSSEE